MAALAPGLNIPEYDTYEYCPPVVLNVVIVGFSLAAVGLATVPTYTLKLVRGSYVSPARTVTWTVWFGATATWNLPLLAPPPAYPHSPSRSRRASCGEFGSPLGPNWV